MTTAESCPMSSIGERFNPLSEEQLEDPYSFYAEARREEPVFYSPAFRMWVVTRYSDARTVLGNPRLFSSRRTIDPIVEIAPAAYAVLATGPAPVPVLVNSDPPDHGRFRRVLNRSFSPPRMRLSNRPSARSPTPTSTPLNRSVGPTSCRRSPSRFQSTSSPACSTLATSTQANWDGGAGA
jgi:cytochrome P450